MESTTIRGIGLSAVIIGVFVAIFPIQFISHTTPALQNVQEAKGTNAPFAYAYANSKAFFTVAAVLVILGLLIYSISVIVKKKEERSLRNAGRK